MQAFWHFMAFYGILWHFIAFYGVLASLPKSLIGNQIRFFPIFRLFPTSRLPDSTALLGTLLLNSRDTLSYLNITIVDLPLTLYSLSTSMERMRVEAVDAIKDDEDEAALAMVG